ncbi:MAG: rhomboid family intramembrane serine protease [Myxococcota bacterium]|nr:rhomboid family intramembrane serine protease [Myxococcota bacterium]
MDEREIESPMPSPGEDSFAAESGSDAGSASDPDRFELRRVPAVVLHASGLRHPRASWISAPTQAESFTAYTDLTHVILGRRSLRICSRRESLLLRRSQLRHPEQAEALVQALRSRVGGLPDGLERLERMAALDARMRAPIAPWISRSLVLVCLVAFALQWLRPYFELTGAFNADLVRAGELWRLLTANVLHGSVTHLAVNAAGLLILGALVEGILGKRGMVFVVGVSALGAMGGSYLANYASAVGASGIVAGLVGSLLWIEWVAPEIVPAAWRLPRGLLIGAIVADSIALAFVPGIAHMAHAFGLVSGAAATVVAMPKPKGESGGGGFLLVADGLIAGAAAAAAFVLLWGVWSPGEAAARLRAERLLQIEGVRPEVLNNEAWGIVIVPDQEPGLLRVARRLAEAAVDRTDRGNPNLLDTLAEVQFQQGDAASALETIDEAILLAPDEPYFREQRRRFSGERAADDRPEPPANALPPPGPPEPLPAEPEDPPGIRI